jgi:hypothetical protein
VRRAQLKRSSFLPFSPTGWWSTAATSAAIFLFLLGYPGRKRRYRAAFFAGLICLISVAIGCGGGSSGGGGGITKVASTTTIVAPSAKVVAGAPYTLTATVTSSKSPTGSVTFFNSGTQLGPAVPLVNGVATFSSSQSFPVGMFGFTAQYSGDTNNLSSQSATAASMAFTGSMSVVVIGQTGTLQRFANINVTLQ